MPILKYITIKIHMLINKEKKKHEKTKKGTNVNSILNSYQLILK